MSEFWLQPDTIIPHNFSECNICHFTNDPQFTTILLRGPERPNTLELGSSELKTQTLGESADISKSPLVSGPGKRSKWPENGFSPRLQQSSPKHESMGWAVKGWLLRLEGRVWA